MIKLFFFRFLGVDRVCARTGYLREQISSYSWSRGFPAREDREASGSVSDIKEEWDGRFEVITRHFLSRLTFCLIVTIQIHIASFKVTILFQWHRFISRTPSWFKATILFYGRHFVSRSPFCFMVAILFQGRHFVISSPFCFKVLILFLGHHFDSMFSFCFKVVILFQGFYSVSRSPFCC